MKKNIIITGASRSIGKAAVEFLSQQSEGKILAIARSKENLEKLKNTINSKAQLLIYPFDLRSGDFEKLSQLIKKEFSSIDILINNAGALSVKPFLEMTDDDYDLQFDINVRSAVKLSQICIPLMPKGSHIVNISSMGGFQGSIKFAGLSLYSASKGAISILTESLAAELVEQGISVNALAFGAVDTDMLRSAFPDYKAPITAAEMGRYLADFALNGAKLYNAKVLPVSSSTP